MGRRKITIQQITDPKLRNITYNKRKNGLIKKAAEISLLCGINLMLVFEDLNGTLVQFSRNKIKSIGNFPKECTYKRVLELTAEDYPNFSPIKRHKKNQENVEEKKFQVPKLNSKNGARCADEMISEHESPMTKEEEVFSTDNDAMSGYTSGLMVTESPETNFSEDYQVAYPRESNLIQPERIKKAFKTTATSQVNVPVKSPNPKELKNRPKLRLNIPKTDDQHKDSNKLDSVGKAGSANSKKQLSSQKTYARKPTFEVSSKPLNLMSPFPFLGLDAQNHQLNIRLANLINSPYKEAVNQRKAATFVNFPGEEDNNGPNFTEYSPFTFQAIGATPPTLKQQRPMQEDHFSTDKIVNYLSHPGRSPPQQQTGVFNFQQPEVYPTSSYDHNNNFGLETELASTRKAGNPFWDFPYNGKESCGKMDNGLPSAGLSGYKFNFDGYSFGNDTGIKDWGEAIRRMKMV